MSNIVLSKRNLSTLTTDFVDAVIQAIEDGELSAVEAWVYLNRIQKAIEALTSDSILRDRVRELTEANVQEIASFEVKKVTGGAILDYEADHKYVELKYALDERKKVLDTARKMKEALYDSEGIEIPKVPVKTYRKDSITVTQKRK